jgi:ribonuclease HI
MKAATPHYLLFSESCRKSPQGQWRFVLQSIDGTEQFEAADAEPNARGERLELLAVVRGLEALAQPSRVTLVTPSKYVNRGLAYGLEEWRANGWQWEHFGEMVPVKNRDLWQRLDRALTYHELEFRTWRFDLPHSASRPSPSRTASGRSAKRKLGLRKLAGGGKRSLAACQRWCSDRLGWFGGTPCRSQLVPLPWLP